FGKRRGARQDLAEREVEIRVRTVELRRNRVRAEPRRHAAAFADRLQRRELRLEIEAVAGFRLERRGAGAQHPLPVPVYRTAELRAAERRAASCRRDELGEVADEQAARPAVSAHSSVANRCIGRSSSCCAAASSASAYPASAWRRTPVPGSVVSTRSRRSPISSVPSATTTMPAWIALPIPTPPPWCTLTHVAPAATLIRAFRIGQSAIASDPSRIAS